MTKPSFTEGDPLETLVRGELVVLPRDGFERVRAGLVERYAAETHFAGPIRLLEIAGGFAVAEYPDDTTGVLRPFGDEAAARRFIQARLDTYDRMWDGCGCKIDYYE